MDGGFRSQTTNTIMTFIFKNLNLCIEIINLFSILNFLYERRILFFRISNLFYKSKLNLGISTFSYGGMIPFEKF